MGVRRECLDGVLCLGKADVARLVIVNDHYLALGVATIELVLGTGGVKMDGEVAVRVPFLVIMDNNRNLLAGLANGELDDLIDRVEVALRVGGCDLRLTLDRADSDATSGTLFVDDGDFEVATGL